jgi:hypothetical protein
VTTDKAPAYAGVLDELLPAACHVTDRYGYDRVEADHGRLKARLRSMRGLKRLAHRRGDHRRACLRAEPPPRRLRTRYRCHPELRLAAAFAELALAI